MGVASRLPYTDTPGLYAFSDSTETFVFIASAVLAVVSFTRYFPLRTNRLFAFFPNPGLGLVRMALVFAGLWFWWVLTHGAAHDIVGYYTLFYVAMAGACLMLGTFWRPILGLYLRGDVVERGNLAAALVLCGFVLGTAFAFGGALTGEGPGWIVVMVFFVLAYAEMRGGLTFADRLGGGLGRQARLDRDASAGILLGAIAAASGLVAGRAAAGDFIDWGSAFADYRVRLVWLPIVPLVGTLAGFLTTERPDKMVWRLAVSVLLVGFGAFLYFWT